LAKAKTKPISTHKNANLDNDAADSSDTSSASRFTLAKGDGRPFGRALHGTMDLIMRMNRVPTDSEVVALVTAKTLQENAVEFETDILNRVRLLLGSNIVQEALSSAHRWPELHLAIADSSDDIRVAEGFADLVYKSDSGYVLVDYKTDKTIDADTYLHYQQQLSAYSIILQNLLGEAPAKIVVLHVTPDTVKEIKIPIPKL
jgi:ATP-dependent exoDNAse (exonuclease V) beta subunit